MTEKGHPLPNYTLQAASLEPGCFALVTGQMHADTEAASCLLWVLDGVVVAQDALAHRGQVSAAVLVSAEGLATDLSGFTLVTSDLKEGRKLAALTALAAPVGTLRVDFEEQVKRDRESLQSIGRGALVFSAATLGLSFLLTSGAPLLLTATFGVLGLKLVGFRASATEQVGAYMQDGLRELQQKWPDRLLQSERAGERAKPIEPSFPKAEKRPEANPPGRQPKWRRQK